MPQTPENEQDILVDLYQRALALYQNNEKLPDMVSPYKEHCQTIIENQERNRAVLAVLVTLLVKKLHSPEQDIRYHQVQMTDGFSGRGLDERVVTPFLRDQQFPYMKAGSGWLTRSLEQQQPYDLNYPGNITPTATKDAFLGLVDGVQRQDLSAENALLVVLVGLIRFRDKSTNLILSRPVNLSVREIVDKVSGHHDSQVQGAARLPVLAIHAILTILIQEAGRYNNCSLLPLEHHAASDARTDLIGDVHIVDSQAVLFEGYEIKHKIPITSELIQASFDKLQRTPVKRFYILTTYPHHSYSEFDSDISRIAQVHGCQLIVNGVDRTLMYYLRLIRDTSAFINKYVSNLETDPAVNFQLKEAWNQIVETRSD